MWKKNPGLVAENVEKIPWEDVRRLFAAICGHLRPLAATCGLRLLAATCGHLRPQVAAENVEKNLWQDVRRPLAGICAHLRPLEWRQVAATEKRMLAATCGQLRRQWQENAGGHLRPLEWLQVAANNKRMLAVTCDYLRLLAATRVVVNACHFQN